MIYLSNWGNEYRLLKVSTHIDICFLHPVSGKGIRQHSMAQKQDLKFTKSLSSIDCFVHPVSAKGMHRHSMAQKHDLKFTKSLRSILYQNIVLTSSS